MALSRRSRLHDFENSKELSVLEKQILKYLHDHLQSASQSVEVKKIFHGVGKKTKKEVNPSLYSLQKKGYIKNVQQSPPLWALVQHESHTTSAGCYVSSASSYRDGTGNMSDFTGNISDFTADDFSSFQPPFGGAATVAGSGGGPAGENFSENRPHDAGKRDDFVIPPSPSELLNDTTSVFGRLNLQGPKNFPEKDDVQSQLLHILNNYDKIQGAEIIKKISGHELSEIKHALDELLEVNKIQKAGEYYSLTTLQAAETRPKSHFLSIDVHGPVAGKAFTTDEVPMVAFSHTPAENHSNAPRAAMVFPEGKNAVSVLNEYAQSRRLLLDYKESVSGPDHMRRFLMTVQLGQQFFRGVSASTKKDAKLKAAESVLERLFSAGEMQSASAVNAPTYMTSSQELNTHQRVASLVINKYNELMQQLPDAIVGRKIIAGFVMSRKRRSGDTVHDVVSIGSGNRCVSGDKLSLRGETVNDCHAEVVARRGLVRYLYREILRLGGENASTQEHLFEFSDGRFSLVPGVEFHLYISTAPCGDSAIFAPSDAATDDPSHDLHDDAHHPLFENKKQGLLRTKVENGEGCIPIEEDTAAPTWDGLLRGERLRTMSCSDKIAKWNFLGLQGSLLSHFLGPIYMSTLTLGMLYNHGHLTRAVCCRVQRFIETVDKELLPPMQYKVHHPVVALSGQSQNRETGKIKTREFSVNWSLGDERPEVLDGTEGKCEQRFGSSNPPRICKAELFKQFKKVYAKMSSTVPLRQEGYLSCKLAATEYQNAKNLLRYAFDKNGYGKWMPKPKEEKDF